VNEQKREKGEKRKEKKKRKEKEKKQEKKKRNRSRAHAGRVYVQMCTNTFYSKRTHSIVREHIL